MRETFWNTIYALMNRDDKIIVLMSDTGFKVMDAVREEFPDRCFNVGIAEQNMISVAAGMAKEGLVPICYAIAPFAVYRCLEQIRDDVCIQSLNVKIVGVGAGFDYNMLGSTHHADSDIACMRAMPNLVIYHPCDMESTEMLAKKMMGEDGPAYFRLTRYGQQSLYSKKAYSLYRGFDVVGAFTTPAVIICSTGVILEQVIESQKLLNEAIGIRPMIIDISILKGALNRHKLGIRLAHCGNIFTVEEHTVIGSLADLVNEMIEISGGDTRPALTRIGIPDTFLKTYGSREHHLKTLRMTAEDIAERILERI